MAMDAPPAAPPAEQPKRNWLLIGGIVAAVLLCCCVITLVAGYFVIVPAMDATNLSIICALETGSQSEECTTWATDVRTNHPADYQECTAQTDVYQCLDDRGLGLND